MRRHERRHERWMQAARQAARLAEDTVALAAGERSAEDAVGAAVPSAGRSVRPSAATRMPEQRRR